MRPSLAGSVRAVLSTLGAVVLMLGSLGPAAAQTTTTTDPLGVFQALLASVNRNDPPATQAAFFAEDALVIGGPCGDQPGGSICVGRAQLQKSLGGPTTVYVLSSTV